MEVVDTPGFSKTQLSITPVTEEELPVFLELLAEYAQSLDESGGQPSFLNDEANLRGALLGDRPPLEAVIARYGDTPAGLACWSESYHVMSGRLTMEIKHIYVRREHRRLPVALMLARHLGGIANEKGYWRVEGRVNGWNKPVQTMYTMLKARKLDQAIYRIENPGRD